MYVADLMYRIRFQWIEWIVAVFFLLLLIKKPLRTKFELLVSKNSFKYFGFVFFCFVFFGLIVKLSHSYNLILPAEDHWLFVDILDNFKNFGATFVSRFTPQLSGFAQHGAVHFYHWTLLPLLPFTYLMDSHWILLVWNTITLGFSGFVLLRLLISEGFKPHEQFNVLLAYLFSSLVSILHNNEMHPETLYPIFTFLMVQSMRESHLVKASIFAAFLGALKADSFLVFLPVVLFLPLRQKNSLANLRTRLFPLVAASFFFVLGLSWVSAYKNQLFGPSEILGKVVQIPTGPLGFNRNTDGLISLAQVFFDKVLALGGVSGFLKTAAKFLFGPFTDFIRYAPWVILGRSFWIFLLPLSVAFSVRGDSAVLAHFYSAPFIALLWSAIVVHPITKKWWASYALVLLSLTHGIISFEFFVPKESMIETRTCISESWKKISPNATWGLVSSPVIHLIDRSKVFTNKLNEFENIKSEVDFVMLHKNWSIFQYKKEALDQLATKIRSEANWEIVTDSNRCFAAKRIR